MAIPTSFDGFSVNGATDYGLTLYAGGDRAPRTMQPVLRPRTNQTPVIDSVNMGELRIPFDLYLKDGAAISEAQFRAAVRQYFNPYVATGRTLLATHDDGSTALTATAWLSPFMQESYKTFSGEFIIPEGCFRSTTVNSDSSSPLTVAGELEALPSLAITSSGSTLARRRVTITDNCTRGLSGYPVAITFDSTGYSAAAAADYIVFYGGRSVPFSVVTPNDANTKVWLAVDCPPAGSVTLDIYYGSGINNTITANAFDDGGMDLTNATNTSWVWDAPYTVSTNPTRCGVWRAVKAGRTVSGVAFGIEAESGTVLDIALAPVATAGNLANDADAIVLVIGTGAGTTNALTNLSRDDISSPTGAYLFFVRYRTANQIGWTTATSADTLGAGSTAAIDLDNAVEVVIGVEPTAATADLTLRLALSGSLTLALNSSLTPTVSAAAAVAAELIDGTITNSTTGDSIAFDDVYLDEAAALTINCLAQTLSVSTGPMHTAGSGIQPSNSDEWFPLGVGSNAWSLPAGVALTISYANRYFV